jgi:hypothetical protein
MAFIMPIARTPLGTQALINALCLAALLWVGPARAQESSAEQMLYLPIYSHIYYGELGKDGKPEQRLMSAHVSIRNMDTRNSIRVLYAQYYDTDGKLVKNYIASPITVPPMGTTELFVPRSDASGGSGANFLIGWKAASNVSPPLVEAVHVAMEMSRTLVFTTVGRPIPPR